MKRIFGLMLLALLGVILGACGGDSAETTESVLPLADDRATLIFFFTDN